VHTHDLAAITDGFSTGCLLSVVRRAIKANHHSHHGSWRWLEIPKADLQGMQQTVGAGNRVASFWQRHNMAAVKLDRYPI
jgi:hypothetical protein